MIISIISILFTFSAMSAITYFILKTSPVFHIRYTFQKYREGFLICISYPLALGVSILLTSYLVINY